MWRADVGIRPYDQACNCRVGVDALIDPRAANGRPYRRGGIHDLWYYTTISPKTKAAGANC